ncbi:hypothetical protein SMC3_01725 [Candidatus Cryosericum hinesii]|jgi:hypothetical protein|uniref:DUF5666 domain-containing protein n=1 Tax=Candidatus Cryosericum hinesii TaxID=2290915 RepID=A0A398DHH2_9BACT|nr:DUF5666 domain-containing protein [Candidatus Cryosericum hinesii]RIE10661.1 hypothetical protein SMC4_01615 [Candidatus Cryosericum hinesii]RIE12877.1 hypothetical protein SMC2_06445 [Candidatus Cryosericum hinesii]RIE14615.1 hypothetical protein SMC3_01725 [Candidatus Cryosericum hinesii]
MEHDDREYTDMLNNELKDIEPGTGLHSKVRDGIARNVVHMRHRNTALGAVVIAVVLTMGLSAVTPVFGRNGTLPQVITAMAAEQQAKKISKTLGTAPVEQTGTALQTSVTTVQTVSDSALSETDGVLALVIANKSGTPVADVLKLRATGLGWGRIMAQLNVSGRDIGKAMSQVKAAAATKGKGENSKPAVDNTDGSKIVVNGEITGVSTSLITVAAKTFVIGSTTQLKYQGKAITPADIATKLAAGKLYATVQGTKQVDTSILANVIIVQDTAEQAKQEQVNEQTNPSNEQAAVSNDQQARGKVTVVTATVLHVDGFANDIILNADTKVEQVGAGKLDITAIKVGQTVQVHVALSATTYTAQQVHIEDKYVKADTTANEDQTTDPSVKTWQGTIAAIFPDKSITVTTEVNSPLVFRIVATSVLQNASHKSFLFATLTVGQKVTIMGKTLADHSVEVVKLIVTTGTSANSDNGNSNDNGKGNGKH